MLPAWWLQPLCVFLFPFLRSLYKNTALLKIKKSDLFCYIYNNFKKALIYHSFIDFLHFFDSIFCRFIGFLLSIFVLSFFCFVHFSGIIGSEPLKGRQLFWYHSIVPCKRKSWKISFARDIFLPAFLSWHCCPRSCFLKLL